MKTQNTSHAKNMPQCFLLITNKNPQSATSDFLTSKNITTSQNSPDLSIFTPEKESLSIEESREIKKLIFQRPLESKHKIVVIPNTQKLSFVVQNSLLKLLEEPPEMAIIILVATTVKNILPTVLSRVIIVEEKTKNSEQTTGTSVLIKSLADLAKIEDPKTWINQFLIHEYKNLIKDIGNNRNNQKLLQSIKLAQETKEMIEANVNPKFALMSLWLKTR